MQRVLFGMSGGGTRVYNIGFVVYQDDPVSLFEPRVDLTGQDDVLDDDQKIEFPLDSGGFTDVYVPVISTWMPRSGSAQPARFCLSDAAWMPNCDAEAQGLDVRQLAFAAFSPPTGTAP